MPGSGASLADVAAAFTVRAAPAVVAAGADGLEQPASTVIEMAAIRTPAAAAPGLNIAGIGKKDGRTPLYGGAPQLVRVSMKSVRTTHAPKNAQQTRCH